MIIYQWFLNLFRSKSKKIFVKKLGSNNIVQIDKHISHQVKINGNNNTIRIRYSNAIKSRKLRKKSKFIINICGNNNTIDIDELEFHNIGQLSIDIGNYTGCDNVNVDIGKHFVVGNATILAYQSNVPISIGDNCLFSSGIIIRSGELPHIIYDVENKQSLDKSDGIFIGNHVWLGQNVFVLKNVSIPDNSIVGSCSVITKRFSEENTVIAGNPAKVCKHNTNWAITKDYI